MKVLLDVNLSPTWSSFLEEHGIEARHWTAVGDPRATDHEILEWARRHGFIVFTNDLDFSRLLALSHAVGPSVFQVRTEDVLPAAIGTLAVKALRENAASLEEGAILVLDASSHRARLLPI